MSEAQARLLAVSHTGLWSGAETVLVRALDALQARGWSTAAAAPAGPLLDELVRRGVDVTPLPELKLPAGSRALAAAELGRRSLAAARRLRHAARGTHVVLVNGLLALPAVRAARLDAPVSWLVHDVIHRRDQRAALRLGGPAVDLAIAVSDAVARPLREAGLRTTVVRNGTRWPPPVERVPPASPPVIGSTSLLTPWKGHEVLLEAMARVTHPTAVLELAGGSFPKDGDYVARLHSRAADPDLQGRVRFLGHVDDVIDRLRHWTVAVIASVDPEAAPLSLLEAMSVGVPVVGTDHGGTSEVLGDAGLLVPPRDPVAKAAAIERLLAEPDLRRRCADAGPRTVAAALTLEHWADELTATLTALVR